MSQDTIPKRFREQIKEAKEQQLEELDLSNSKDSDNKLLKKFSNLLSDRTKPLTKIPEEVFELKQIKTLDLSGNSIDELPEFIGNLSNLSVLNLGGNQLSTLPESIGNLSNLSVLNLWGNQLSTLPESIGNLSNLSVLNLGGNQLSTLPESIGNLSNLSVLNLWGNQLSTLPESIGNLSNLSLLDLWGNQLSTLPESIGNLSNLSVLNLGKNPLEAPPIEVIDKGTKAIVNYFRQLKEEGKDYIYEAKLLIVGEGGTGKTTLAKKIEDPNYELDINEKSTEGIDITKWSFPFDNEREFKVNIWDFGGQEIYHATHQFFLTKRSLYALVADTRKEDTDFYYWLNVVELLSDNSPLLIIKNEKQDRKREINERALRGQFTNLKETLATNLKTNRGLKEILTNIQDYIKKLPHIGQALPKTWVKVRSSLEKKERNYISLQEYLDICESNGFTNLPDKLQLSGYLHDLGVCLHFQDEEDSLLYKTVILKPEWGTDGVYKVLDNQQVINNQGHFTRNDLKSIWHESQYASMRGELLELMKKFQLCYEIPGSKDSFIAPQLLSENQPDYDWNESDNLIFRYSYEFMPKGIITQFIVAMHQYIDQQQYVWKSGVLLNKNETLAEVIEYYDKRELKIRVSGKQKKDLLTIISYELGKIHASYQRLKYHKLIPCNCQKCKFSQSPHFFPYEVLRNFVTDRQEGIQCQKSYQMVNVLSLIDDAIDIKQLISKNKRDSNKSFHVEGDIQQLILLEQGDISGDIKMIRERNINQHGKGDNIAGNKVMGDKVMGDKSINQSRNINISDNAKVTASGAGAFNQGDNHSTIANNINQNDSQQSKDSKVIKILGTLAAIATIIALFFSGIFTPEARQWFDNLFDKNVPSKTEPRGK